VTPSQRWLRWSKQREEQVFLLVTLLIGALVGVTVVAFIVSTNDLARVSMRPLRRHGGAWWFYRRLAVHGFLLYKYFPDAARRSAADQAALFARGDGSLCARCLEILLHFGTLASGIPAGREAPRYK